MSSASRTSTKMTEAFECLDCRQARVACQVADGLRPATDLDPENLPENRNPQGRGNE
jgi:hypothetical protein